jgi:methylenetetrahydrofolate dehydrogenase (NADP+)/methenyltetrahydrofolate cyclohydrolase
MGDNFTNNILRGNEIAKALREQIAEDIRQRTKQGFRTPMLAVILVGDDPASQVYVRNKKNACEQVGINTVDYSLLSSISQVELLALIHKLNLDPTIDGILVQMPLPFQMNPSDIVESINPDKDVDGFHPYNLGRLAQGRPYLRPCTPAGVMTLLEHTQEKLAGKKATVVGTSNIVGLPMILELIRVGCTVTTCNKRTRDLAAEVKVADITVVAAGHPNLIKGEWIKPGSIVIDVGMNRLPDGHLCGDVEFDSAKERAGWITPVPGGVGPMTIASLLSNTLLANINRQLPGNSQTSIYHT